MAPRRESQGLQITLIVFVMLTIILAVTTIAFWNKSKALTVQNTTLTTQNTENRSAMEAAMDQRDRMKAWIGHTADTSVEDVETQYKNDMNTYASSAPELQRNYKDVPAVLFSALQQRNKQVTDVRQQLADATRDFETTKKQLQDELEAARTAQASTEASMRQLRDEFAKQREMLNTDKEQALAQIRSLRQQLQELEASSQAKIQELERDIANKTIIISQRDNQLRELSETTFETPDGKITFVNVRTGRVLLNLGRADGLRRQVTFNVYGVDVNNVALQEKKATIEVTRIISDHVSEATIVSDNFADPILSGDVIYTPLWNAKSALRFAIAGSLDINGDGVDDRELVKNLIRINGGKIDAEEADGDIQGEITARTRYLIRGEAPAVGDDVEADTTARQNAWSKMIDQASEFGVEQLNVEKLVDFLVGFDGDKRVIPLGSRALTDDFMPSRDPLRGSEFRDRRPRSLRSAR